ncbi:MAG: energy transducer TonB, partial [Sutterella sp.]|nr:energy transducer TonB [Sutterella sp.]
MKISPSQQKKKDTERTAASFVAACCVYVPLLWGVFWVAPGLTYKAAGQIASVSLSFAQISGGGIPAAMAAETVQPETSPEPQPEEPPAE